jgi:hypothetical protein
MVQLPHGIDHLAGLRVAGIAVAAPLVPDRQSQHQAGRVIRFAEVEAILRSIAESALTLRGALLDSPLAITDTLVLTPVVTDPFAACLSRLTRALPSRLSETSHRIDQPR